MTSYLDVRTLSVLTSVVNLIIFLLPFADRSTPLDRLCRGDIKVTENDLHLGKNIMKLSATHINRIPGRLFFGFFNFSRVHPTG